MRLITALFLLVAVSAFACKGKKNASNDAPVNEAKQEQPEKAIALFYQRTACFGTCPIFKFSLFSDNTCLYEGENFVDRIGTFTGKGDRDELIKVIDAAERIGYRDFDDVYDNPMIMDIPSVLTQVNTDGKMKSCFDRYKGPAQLDLLYEAFDQLILTIEWQEVKQ